MRRRIETAKAQVLQRGERQIVRAVPSSWLELGPCKEAVQGTGLRSVIVCDPGASCPCAFKQLVLICLVCREQAASRLLATVAGSVGSVVAVVILVYMYWRWEMAPVSRRLIGSSRGQEANQKDLPYELRKKYEAVKVLGSGSYGVVIAAWQLSDKKRTIRRAIKLVHARHRKFEEKDLRRLNREVMLEHTALQWHPCAFGFIDVTTLTSSLLML